MYEKRNIFTYNFNISEEIHKSLLREVRIWAKGSRSQYIVQYHTSWTENIVDDTDESVDKGTGQSKSEYEGDEISLTGHILFIQMDNYMMTLGKAHQQSEHRQTIDRHWCVYRISIL
jgi:hypothetical protein